MYYYFIALLGLHIARAAPPLKLTIDCGSQETDYPRATFGTRSANIANRVDVNSLCSIFHRALPKSVNDGKFILIGEPTDQSQTPNEFTPITVPPPRGFIPRQRIKVPNLKVPRLKAYSRTTRPLFAPRVGASMRFPSVRTRAREEESSAERMEKFKKGVQKMLHVVKVLGQIDQYLSERTRSIVDVLSNTFTERTDSNNVY